jgi:hypothetical protein
MASRKRSLPRACWRCKNCTLTPVFAVTVAPANLRGTTHTSDERCGDYRAGSYAWPVLTSSDVEARKRPALAQPERLWGHGLHKEDLC